MKSLIGTLLKRRERTLRLRRDIDPRCPVQMIVQSDEQQVEQYKANVADNWKERRRIRRAA